MPGACARCPAARRPRPPYDLGQTLEAESASNLKQTWCDWLERDWFNAEQGEGEAFLSRATQVKNIWIPYGE